MDFAWRSDVLVAESCSYHDGVAGHKLPWVPSSRQAKRQADVSHIEPPDYLRTASRFAPLLSDLAALSALRPVSPRGASKDLPRIEDRRQEPIGYPPAITILPLAARDVAGCCCPWCRLDQRDVAAHKFSELCISVLECIGQIARGELVKKGAGQLNILCPYRHKQLPGKKLPLALAGVFGNRGLQIECMKMREICGLWPWR
jgi:hypothetical protein